MRKPLTIATLAALAVAGTLAALAVPQAANAWDWHQLPAGYSVFSSFTTVCHVATDPCVGGEGSTCTHLGVAAGSTGVSFVETDCVNPTFQADLDAFVGSTICQVNPAAGGAACAPPTTAATTTAPPDPAATTTTAVQPQPTQTVTVTATAADVQTQLDDLKSQIAALKGRVDKLEAAADAEWLSYHDALVAGLDPIMASMVARQTGYDLIHGTGPFAP